MKEVVNLAKGIIDAESANLYGIYEIADRIGVSPAYLCRAFKAEMGIPPIKYLNQIKVNTAKEILGDHSLPLNMVAQMSGFSDAASFCKIFKKQTGLTPGAFRESTYHKFHRRHKRNHQEDRAYL